MLAYGQGVNNLLNGQSKRGISVSLGMEHNVERMKLLAITM